MADNDHIDCIVCLCVCGIESNVCIYMFCLFGFVLLYHHHMADHDHIDIDDRCTYTCIHEHHMFVCVVSVWHSIGVCMHIYMWI